MSTYKVIQDIEAEDKLVGPLTLRQFIYAGIAALCLWLGFLCATKHAAFLLVFFLPVAGVTGFFAFPWGQDQPTEVWALAKIRFAIKPRRRIWDQSGAKQLVTITVPKKIERQLTNGLDQDEVHSRLNALASTIDSRGWAIKNVNVNLASQAILPTTQSDRLVAPNSMPQEVSNFDVRASDDMLDESANPVAQHFETMINASAAAHRQQIIEQMQQPLPPTPPARAPFQPPIPTPAPIQATAGPAPQMGAQPPADYWFLQQPAAAPAGQTVFADTQVVLPGNPGVQPIAAPQAAIPTAEEEALVEKLKQENSSQTVAYGHLRTLKTPAQLAAEEAAQRAAAAAAAAAKPKVTPQDQAAIMNLANNDDLDVATLARQAHREVEQSDGGEVVISLR